MNDGDALLAAIRAHPDEDTPRLAYADWLDETGSPARARFVRRQIEQADGPGTWWRLAGNHMRPCRFEDLLAAAPWGDARVTESIAALGYVQPSSSSSAVLWRRGLIEGVMCTPLMLADYMGVLSAHPVREVRLTQRLTVSTCLRIRADWTKEDVERYRDPDSNHRPFRDHPRFPAVTIAEYEDRAVSERFSPFELVAKKKPAE